MKQVPEGNCIKANPPVLQTTNCKTIGRTSVGTGRCKLTAKGPCTSGCTPTALTPFSKQNTPTKQIDSGAKQNDPEQALANPNHKQVDSGAKQNDPEQALANPLNKP